MQLKHKAIDKAYHLDIEYWQNSNVRNTKEDSRNRKTAREVH